MPGPDGAGNNNHQNNANQMNFQENYQESEITQDNENFVDFSPITTGFPVYPMFPFGYYQSPTSNYIGSYMPNMYQPMPGFGNNEFLQNTSTNRANSVSLASNCTPPQRTTDLRSGLFPSLSRYPQITTSLSGPELSKLIPYRRMPRPLGLLHQPICVHQLSLFHQILLSQQFRQAQQPNHLHWPNLPLA